MTSHLRMVAMPALLALAVLTAAAVSAQVDPEDREEFAATVAQWDSILDFPETLLTDPGIRAQELAPLAKSVELVRELSRETRAGAEVDYARALALLEALGPPPGEGEPPEASDIAKKRALLTEQVAYFDGQIKQTKVVSARAREILDRIGDLEVSIIASTLGRRLQSPLAPGTIAAGFRDYPTEVRGFLESIQVWWRNAKLMGGIANLVTSLAILLVGLVAIFLVRSRFVSRWGMVPGIEEPSLGRRFVGILVEALSRVVLPVLLIGGAGMIFISNAGFPRHLEANFTELVKAMIDYILIIGLAGACLTSARPQWRITRFSDAAAAGLENDISRFALTLLIISILVTLVNPEVGQASSLRIVDFSVTTKPVILMATVWVLASSILTLRVLRPANWQFYEKSDDTGETTVVAMPLNVKTLFTIAKVLILGGALVYVVGYMNLGLYIMSRTIATLGLIAIALLLHGLVRESLRQATSVHNPFGRWVRDRFAIEDAAADRWNFWIVLLFDVVLFIVFVILLLTVWGVPWTEIRPALLVLVYGTEIGGHTFSLFNVGLALGAFILLMLGVRLFQGLLANRILVQTRLDVGVRDAVTAGVGYVGVVVAVLVALSLIGFNFGDIALIFGALSIGIGFGLQHVVNNFISGLVLLVQRPIKSGDWIVVGSGADASQGYVKRINVIATEITTFDNATVIVPNSQLMTMEVMNWTHRGRLGRVKVPVGVSYSSDPEQVKEILLRCARDNQSVLRRPAPNVLFMNFGESSLDFELRVFIRDIDYVFAVASELRFAIMKAFREAGIEIPFPQRDVHVKSTPAGALDQPA